jgi:hypothetical protein
MANMNSRIYIPATEPEDWRSLLADPEKHWRDGYSAMSLAYAWQQANGFPREIQRVFQNSEYLVFRNMEMLLAFPEHKVPLPGGLAGSQNDLFVLARGDGQLISMTVEGKVSEPFGPLVSEWIENSSEGKKERLAFLCKTLGLDPEQVQPIRYQLLHRTASAVIEAGRFSAKTALMLVHSFSPTNESFEDFSQFAVLFGLQAQMNQIVGPVRLDDLELHLGWIKSETGSVAGGVGKRSPGEVVARKCKYCGHHEIGMVSETGDYKPLKPGMKVELLPPE